MEEGKEKWREEGETGRVYCIGELKILATSLWEVVRGVGLTIERSCVQLPAGALPGSNSGQVVHTHVPVNKQYNLVPAKGR